MKIDVKHIQKRGKAGWRYRRKIPEELRAILGKREILIPLGPTEAIAIKKYPTVHAEAEKLLLSAVSSKKAPSPNSHQLSTALEQFKWGQQHVRRLQLDPEWSGADDEHDSEALHREVIAEQIAAKYPIDERGNPIGVCYNAAHAYMLIRLKQTWYHYCEIDQGTVSALLAAGSKGAFYTENIKDAATGGTFGCRDKTVPEF